MNRSGLYLNLLPHLNSKTIKLLDHPRSINQICALERSTRRGANDQIDHPRGQHDDVANAIAGLAHILSNKRGQYGQGVGAQWYGPSHLAPSPNQLRAFAQQSAERNVEAGSAPCTIDFKKLEAERLKNVVPGVTRSRGTRTGLW